MKIGIDTGHGGNDPGATGKGMLEKKINLNVVNKLVELLKAKGFDIVLTRPTDTNMTRGQRARIANNARCNILISVHHNAGGGNGYDVIHSVRGGASKRLAELIGEEFGKLGQKKHKIYSRSAANDPKTDYHGIIQFADMPTVITEFAFLDTKDVEHVDTLAEQWKEAEAIRNAVVRYFKK